jgi:sialate O-acetylesterase
MRSPLFLVLAALTLAAPGLHAQLRLPAIISDGMVLQQQQANPLWGWDTPGTAVTVTFAGQTHRATAGADGRWTVRLTPLSSSAEPRTLAIAGSSQRTLKDVLVGEVWMCSGQSNMQWSLSQSYHGDLEALATDFPQVRLISVPQVGTQELQADFNGKWEAASPATAPSFSAVGLIFGRYLHQVLKVPVGLIDNAWGGSAAEAWVRRSALEADPHFAALMAGARQREASLLSPEGRAAFEASLQKHREDFAKAKAAKKAAPRAPQDWLTGNARPGNIFAGVVHPTLGYGMKGVIWYQGESNAPRAHEYATLFPFMIEQWRKEWGQGDFPFYWVQLADFRDEKPRPGESDWAELREAQTKTQRLPNTGQAVIIDVGEGRDIHPRNKQEVGARLARIALARDYGRTLPHRSPEFRAAQFEGGKAVVTLDTFGSSLRAFDVAEVRGFALCGEDRVWHWATGRILGSDRVEVSCPQVAAPVAVRYAWADNPVCNLYSADGLPATPFRSDDFPLTTAPKPAAK